MRRPFLLLLLLAIAPAEAPAKPVVDAAAAAECLERADARLAAGAQSEALAAALGACLREGGLDVGNLFAKSCYDQTLWARMYFDARRRGVALERMRALHPGLAESVYATRQTEAEFRRELFLGCALPPLSSGPQAED